MAVLHVGCCPALSPSAWCLGPLNLRTPVLMRYFLPYKHLSLGFWAPIKVWEGGCLL